MWKCIRCEKENKDTAEICTECGHGRTMDYAQHRTLSKISAKLAKNWKISRNTEKEIEKLNNENRKKIQDLKKKYRQTQLQAQKDATKETLHSQLLSLLSSLQAKKDATKETPNENRKNAEEVIQKKLSSLRSSVAFMKDEISKEQDEINGLHVVVEEQNKLIEKDIKADKKVTTIAAVIAATIITSLFVYIVYRYRFNGRWTAVEECVNLGNWTTPILIFAIVMCDIGLAIDLEERDYLVFDIFVRIIDLLIGRFIGKISYETWKQAKTERDNAQNSIDKKKNEINSIYQKIAPLEKQISKIESNMSTLTDNLSRVLPEHMSEELERWTR